MKNLILVLSILFFCINGCQIMSSEKPTIPEISIGPMPIFVDRAIEVKIESSTDFIMPYCGGINYKLEKLDAQNWQTVGGEFGPCNTMILPEMPISKSTSIMLIIEEPGIFRFSTSFKFDRDEVMRPLYSDNFEVLPKE